MTYENFEADFSMPDFRAHLDSVEQEHKDSVEDMLKEAFDTLSRAEKLMMRPLIDLCELKKQQLELEKTATTKALKKEISKDITHLEKKIQARLHVINENGDIQVLVKRFNVLLFELNKKKSLKSLAKIAASALLTFVESLRHSGELWH